MDAFCRRALARPALTRHEERRLATSAKAGDAAARDELVCGNLRSVVLRALLLGARGDRLADAVQAGAVGLLKAVDRFDPDRGVRLATFAWAWIGAEISAELHQVDGSVPPDDVASAAPQDDAALWLDGLSPVHRDVLQRRFGIGAEAAPQSRRIVAEQLDLTPSQVRRIEAEAMRHLSTGLARIDARAPAVPAPVPCSSIGRAADC